MRHLHLGAFSGTIAATTSGTIFCFKNPSPEWRYIQAFEFYLATISPPTLAASIALDVALTAIGAASAAFTGGTDISDQAGAGAANYAISARIADTQRTLNASKVNAGTLAAGNARIATTTALGGGAAGAAQPFKRASFNFAPATTVLAYPPITLAWKNPSQGLEHEDPLQGCIILPPDTALIVRTGAALPAGFTAELGASIDFLE